MHEKFQTFKNSVQVLFLLIVDCSNQLISSMFYLIEKNFKRKCEEQINKWTENDKLLLMIFMSSCKLLRSIEDK